MAARHDYSDPTANKFGKPSYSLPTPEWEDLVIVETVPGIRQGQKWKKRKGTLHPVEKTAVLLSCARTVGNDTTFDATYVYATPRVNQDAYNFSLSWARESAAHVIVSRSSLVLREGYIRTANGTADVANEGAILVHEEAAPAEEQYNNLYFRRTQVFETVPGPVITSYAPDERGDIATITEQTVPAGTMPDPQTLLAASTVQGVDAVKAAKTNTSVASHRTLGGTEFNERGEAVTTADSLVAPGTAPADGLLVDSDAVTDQTATKARRVRKTVSARATLHTVENRKLGRQESLIPPKFVSADTLTITRDIVPPGTAPEARSNVVLSSIVEDQTLTKALKTTTARPDAPYPTLGGSEVLGGLGGAVGVSNEQIVAAGTAADTGFNVARSSVTTIDATNSEKDTVRVASFPALPGAEYRSNIPEKFLAEFNLATVEDWVDTTSATAASYLQTTALVISCKVVPETIYRAKRTTVSLPTGATLPTLTSQKINAEGLVETIVEHVGASTISGQTALTTSDSIEAVSANVRLETKGTVDSYPVLLGQKFDAQLGVPLPFTERTMSLTDAAGYAGAARTDITPRDALRSVVKQETVPTAGYAAYSRSIPITIEDIYLPDVLTALDVVYEGGGSDGSYSDTGTAGGTQISVGFHGSGTGVAAMTPKVLYVIDRRTARKVPAMQYDLLLPNPATRTQVKTALATIIGGGVTLLDWPSWHTKAVNLFVRSEKMSVQVQVDSRLSWSDSGNYANIQGSGTNVDYSPSITQIDIPPTLHAAFSLSGSSTITKTAQAQCGAGTAIAKDSGVFDVVATGSVYPTTIAATSVTSIPTTGLFLYDLKGQNYRDGYLMFVAVVLDASNLP